MVLSPRKRFWELRRTRGIMMIFFLFWVDVESSWETVLGSDFVTLRECQRKPEVENGQQNANVLNFRRFI